MDSEALPDDFRDLLIAFADARVAFVVVGGYALAAHGYLRATDDLDILIQPTASNAQRVFAALVAFGAPIEAHGVQPDLFAREGYGYRMGVKPLRIEILTSITGVSFEEAWRDHGRVEVAGRTVPVIGREALLANKRAAGRHKDLADVEWLEGHPPATKDD